MYRTRVKSLQDMKLLYPYLAWLQMYVLKWSSAGDFLAYSVLRVTYA